MCTSPMNKFSTTRHLITLCAWAVFAVGHCRLLNDGPDKFDRLIGWLGETHGDDSASKLRGVKIEQILNPRVETLSWSPRAFLYHGLLSGEECDHLMKLAQPHLERSQVVDNNSGDSTPDSVRTSSGAFLARAQDEIVARIERRIADITHIPAEHGEGLHVLRYQSTQKYDAHFDYFHDPKNVQNGGNRLATVLMYLTDVEEGGETLFPSARGFDRRLAERDDLSDCARGGLAVKPKRGDAVLFYSLKFNGDKDTSSLHAGCPVIKGEKWSATKWMHIDKYMTVEGTDGDPDACVDRHKSCPEWALAGECEKNAIFMVGALGDPGQCRKSCNVCSP